MSRTLFILNDPPYATERTYTGLRLAGVLSKRENHEVHVFLIGDATTTAKRGQQAPANSYNVETMLRTISKHGAEIGVCGSCMDMRGMQDDDLSEGTRRSSIDQLSEWMVLADRVLVF